MSEQLLEACIEGNLSKVRSLLNISQLMRIKKLFNRKKIVDINYQDCKGFTALRYACMYGHLNIIKYLLTSNDLTKNVDIHDKDKDGWSTLMCACLNGHLDIVQYLLTSNDLKEHANLYDKNKFGYNSLTLACQKEHYEVAHYLIINQNMKIDQKTIDLLTRNNNEDILEMIKTRDLYHKMNDNLSKNISIVKQRKI